MGGEDGQKGSMALTRVPRQLKVEMSALLLIPFSCRGKQYKGNGDRIERSVFCAAKNSNLTMLSESTRNMQQSGLLHQSKLVFKGKKTILTVISKQSRCNGIRYGWIQGSKKIYIIKTLSLTISALPYPKYIYSLAEFYQKLHQKIEKQPLTSTDIYIIIQIPQKHGSLLPSSSSKCPAVILITPTFATFPPMNQTLYI